MNNADKAKNINVINNLNKNYKQFTFDFVSKSKIFLIIAGVVFLTGVISFFVNWFNFDIDFTGGAIIEYKLGKDLADSDIEEIEALIKGELGESKVLSVARSTSSQQQAVIKTQPVNNEERTDLNEKLAEKYGVPADEILVRSNNTAATVGDDLKWRTILLVLASAVLMLIYIAVRFDVKSGLAAILCQLFDLFVMLTVYSLLHLPMDVAVIAAFLTILGYSIKATIVVFDRVRENMKMKKGSGMQFSEIINQSVSQTLARSINTTITTFFVLIVLFILGVPSVRTFVLPLIVGITSGLFSSVCLSGPLWNFFKTFGKSKANDTAKAK